MDYVGPLDGQYYLIVVDSFSKWLEVFRCKSLTTDFTIKTLHELFARFRVVDCLVSDNGTQFISGDFKEFMEDFQEDHITTPTYHPRSNGQAERFVDTMKRALKKAKDTPLSDHFGLMLACGQLSWQHCHQNSLLLEWWVIPLKHLYYLRGGRL